MQLRTHKTGAGSSGPGLRFQPHQFRAAQAQRTRVRDVEVVEMDGHSAAATAMGLVGVTTLVAVLIWAALAILGAPFDIPGVTVDDAWYLAPFYEALLLCAIYLFVRGSCWLYNAWAGRFGGVVFRLRD